MSRPINVQVSTRRLFQNADRNGMKGEIRNRGGYAAETGWLYCKLSTDALTFATLCFLTAEPSGRYAQVAT